MWHLCRNVVEVNIGGIFIRRFAIAMQWKGTDPPVARTGGWYEIDGTSWLVRGGWYGMVVSGIFD